MPTLPALLALSLLASPALAADLPRCDASSVLDTIVARQHGVEQRLSLDGVVIATIARPGETATTTPHSYAFAQRHCTATAVLAGGGKRALYYVITAEGGYAGYGWSVDYCLPGHDRFYFDDADCRVLR